MHSWTFRLNAIFTYTVSILGALSILNIFTVYFSNPSPIATIENIKLQRLPGSGPNRPNAEARVMFDMKADFRPLFNWNTKLVFVYVTAEYETKLNALNQIVLWDYIIEDIANADFTVGRHQTMLLPRHHNEYPLIDQGRGLRSLQADANLTLHWCVMPIVGSIFRRKEGKATFPFPSTWDKLPAVGAHS